MSSSYEEWCEAWGQTLLVDGGLSLKWSHLDADNTSLFLKDESFRAAITRWEEP